MVDGQLLKMMRNKIIGLVPTRIASTRLPGKALAEIEGMPVVIHAAKRAMLSNSVDKVYVCTDSDEIIQACNSFEVSVIKTESHFTNGTERIASVADDLDAEYFIDIQGDEPLVDPAHIDIVAEFIVNNQADIVIPSLEVPYSSSENIIRVQSSTSGRVMTLTRALIPHRFCKTIGAIQKHLSVIGFSRQSLLKYAMLSPTLNESCESIELLRAIENDFNVFTIKVKGDSFSVDVYDDLVKARASMRSDSYFGRY